MGITKSRYAKDKVAVAEVEEVKPEGVKLTITDTEYLLRKLMDASIDGREVEQASDVLKKVKDIHQRLMEQGIEINSG